MSANPAYVASAQLRVVAPTGAWNQVDIPAGAVDALLTVDDAAATWRLSADSGIPLTTGTFVAAAGGVTYAGEAAAVITVYVNPSANTTVQVLYQTKI